MALILLIFIADSFHHFYRQSNVYRNLSAYMTQL